MLTAAALGGKTMSDLISHCAFFYFSPIPTFNKKTNKQAFFFPWPPEHPPLGRMKTSEVV